MSRLIWVFPRCSLSIDLIIYLDSNSPGFWAGGWLLALAVPRRPHVASWLLLVRVRLVAACRVCVWLHHWDMGCCWTWRTGSSQAATFSDSIVTDRCRMMRSPCIADGTTACSLGALLHSVRLSAADLGTVLPARLFQARQARQQADPCVRRRANVRMVMACKHGQAMHNVQQADPCIRRL